MLRLFTTLIYERLRSLDQITPSRIVPLPYVLFFDTVLHKIIKIAFNRFVTVFNFAVMVSLFFTFILTDGVSNSN